MVSMQMPSPDVFLFGLVEMGKYGISAEADFKSLSHVIMTVDIIPADQPVQRGNVREKIYWSKIQGYVDNKKVPAQCSDNYRRPYDPYLFRYILPVLLGVKE